MRRVCFVAVAVGALAAGGEAVAQARSSRDPRLAASADTVVRVLVSVRARRLWVLSGRSDTLLHARVAVGSGKTLRASGQTWIFETPRGIHTVLSKEEDPIWIRPEWSYVEAARRHDLRLAHITAGKPVILAGGQRLAVRDDLVGIGTDSNDFAPLPDDEEIVFGGVLYVPPIETRHRRVPGQLGRYRLNLGDGIGLHGTPDTASIGRAVTHGCLRLYDEDIAWLYRNLPIGTRVYIF